MSFITLGIDSSGHTASCALLEDGIIIGEYSTCIGLTHSETLLPMLEELIERCGKRVSELNLIAVSAGPGSFTGLRIGAATGKGIALAHHIPMVAVSTLCGLAQNVSELDAYIHPIMDARRNQVYTACFLDGKLLGEEEAISVEELVEKLNRMGGKHVFLGDAVSVYKDYLDEKLTVEHNYVGAGNVLQRASSIAILGYKTYLSGAAVDSRAFQLSYVRKPQAEREKESQGLKNFDLAHEGSEEKAENLTKDRLAPVNYSIGSNTGYENYDD